jgi:hydrogenase maturation factor
MCAVLPARVVAIIDQHRVEVELADGQRVEANVELKPYLTVGAYVLVDRGLVVETVSDDEALAILQMYAEIGELLDAEDGRVSPTSAP